MASLIQQGNYPVNYLDKQDEVKMTCYDQFGYSSFTRKLPQDHSEVPIYTC